MKRFHRIYNNKSQAVVRKELNLLSTFIYFLIPPRGFLSNYIKRLRGLTIGDTKTKKSAEKYKNVDFSNNTTYIALFSPFLSPLYRALGLRIIGLHLYETVEY